MARYDRLPPQYQPTPPDYLRCNHVLHALLTLFLCGLWAPVWLCVALHVGVENRWLRARYAEAWQSHLAYWHQAPGWQQPQGGPPVR